MKQTTQEAHDDFILRCECELADSDLRNAVRREKRRLERVAKIKAADDAAMLSSAFDDDEKIARRLALHFLAQPQINAALVDDLLLQHHNAVSDLRNAVRREKRRLERVAKITAANAATLSR